MTRLSRCSSGAAAILVALLSAIPWPAHAVLVRHDRPDSLYREFSRDYAPVLGNLGGAVGTLVGDRWVVTAAHVALNVSPFSRSFRIGAESVPISDIYIYPGFSKKKNAAGGDELDLEVPDLALVRLARPVTGVTPARLHRDRDEVGRTIVVAGNGATGTGESGPTNEDGVLRAATNVVEEVSGRYFAFSFSAPGDSGVTESRESAAPVTAEAQPSSAAITVSRCLASRR